MSECRELEARLSELEEESLSTENFTLEDFPEILMQNLREHYESERREGDRGDDPEGRSRLGR